MPFQRMLLQLIYSWGQMVLLPQ
ncbi:unnamed protein product [Staurois parvus]|uniref:Uncharacterized protein n=1 Tax=Staurois parvus TaxID=386267 RepID=A0ABN9GFI3_9NEOB|nr:unnamed protein product [Staurois parvus]